MPLGPGGDVNHHDGIPVGDLSITELALTFCFEVFTDLAFVPPLLIMHTNRRHFELYIGIFQLTTGFLYNFCNALNIQVFLTELQWHALNNILTTTYFLLLLIHLQANANPNVDIVLRYIAFSAARTARRTRIGRRLKPAVPRPAAARPTRRLGCAR